MRAVAAEARGGSGRPALSCTGLVKRYGRTAAVDGVDLEVRRGSVVGLVGPNGSGKTTALRLCVGLERPDRGFILVDGEPQGSPSARARAAFVPDEPDGLDELTVAEYVSLVRALYRAPAAYDVRARALLAAFRLDARTRAQLGSLSHGMRRAVSIVAALALAPPLVVVDEAAAALDPEAAVVFREALRASAGRGSGALVATQELHFAERVCDRVVLLCAGRVVASGDVASVVRRHGASSLEEAFVAAIGGGGRIDALRSALRSL